MSRCVIGGCRELGEHLDGCTSDRCKGCRPRAVDKGFVCPSDRTGLGAVLADIRDLDAQLREEADPLDHQDWLRVPVPTSDPVWLRPWCWLRPAREAEDVLARVLPMGIVKSALGAGARVSGSKEPAAPTNLDRLDLAGEARHGEPILALVPATRVVETPVVRRYTEIVDGVPVVREEKYTARRREVIPKTLVSANDQAGYLSAATILDSWVREWREYLFADHHLPAPAVTALVGWLSNRLGEACDHHEGIDEFAQAIRELRRTLRGVLGLNAPPKELCRGVFCKACDFKTLYREGGLISCGNCGENYSANAYLEWIGLLNAETKQRLRDGDLAMPDSPEVRRLVA